MGRDHPRGCSSVSRGMAGQEKKRGFSDFGLYIKNFQKLNLEFFLFPLQPPKIYCSCFLESNSWRSYIRTILVCFIFVGNWLAFLSYCMTSRQKKLWQTNQSGSILQRYLFLTSTATFTYTTTIVHNIKALSYLIIKQGIYFVSAD